MGYQNRWNLENFQQSSVIEAVITFEQSALLEWAVLVLYINLSQVAKCQKLDDISIISMLSVKSKVFCIILIQSVQKQFVQLEKSPPVKIRIQSLWTHSRSCLEKTKYIFIILILSLNCSEQYFYAGTYKDYTVLRLVEKFTWYIFWHLHRNKEV